MKTDHLEFILREIQASALEIRQRLSAIDRRLDAIQAETPKTLDAVDAKYLRRSDVCREFGISQSTLTTWMRRGQIPFTKIGQPRFSRADVQAALAKNRRGV